ncbi:unnamed protein product [Fusarium venenatum]|uniref:Heterokaryon incompatibility domain-containing protein n=1 Tax=Fusarium venenatum TaxID=56646 RepID=A0A2L2TMZ9_9HYPO|nr:uncharacterized protein FVRRES_06336 [Fusarium venenatum]CEI61900.1 unnamed protein product [Fusarium venenatum]
MSVSIGQSALSRAEAKEHIEQIRREYSLEGHDKLAQALTNALHILSTELYDQSTHFIQELLQNADDNHFETSTPTLIFSYSPGRLRVDCNEKGFLPRHIDALCTIRGSTKTDKDQAPYTGEKGIGFKSVFRMADVVWISSNSYQFKFDKHKQFGTVAPEWVEDFPVHSSSEYTTFYLELCPQDDMEELVEKLVDFDADQLLFLRRLRQVKINIEREHQDLSHMIRRIDETDGCGNLITTLDLGTSKKRFMVRKFQVTNLPEEPRRRNQTCSEMVLAFPLMEELPDGGTAMPVFEAKLFAGLPVGVDGGLKFLLQGDFILTASRLHLDTSLRWNQGLRDGLVNAFLESVLAFNAGIHRYIWPFFLSYDKKVSSFFQSATKSICEMLRLMDCLESMEGTMVKPSALTYVDLEKFGDSSEDFLTLSAKTSPLYLSNKYPAWTIPGILSLGVRRLSATEFLEHFRTLLSEEDSAFRKKSSSWHGDLAKVLLSLISDERIRKDLRNLPIIPLTEGRWVSASNNPKPVFVSKDLELDDFPTHSGLPIVDPEATAHKDRKALYQALGIATIGKDQVCEFICQQHASPDFKPEKWTTEQLIKHAKMLFESHWTPPAQHADLWFVTADDRRCRGSSLCFREEAGSPAYQRIFKHLEQESPTLHPDYFKDSSVTESPLDGIDLFSCPQQRRSIWSKFRKTGRFRMRWGFDLPDIPGKVEDRSWKEFLVKSLQLSAIPRLAVRTAKGTVVSKEFKSILRNCPVTDWLQLLEDEWHTYSKWLGPGGENAVSYSNYDTAGDLLSTKVKNLEVLTSRGRQRLCTTFVPGLDDLVADVPIPILDIKGDIGKVTRERLRLLGVTVEKDIRYYLSCLRALVDQVSPDVETLTYIYERIQAHYNDEDILIEYETMHAFQKDRLIYVDGWAVKNSDKCRKGWFNAEQCSDKKIRMGELYPRCEALFRSLMITAGLNINGLVEKATKMEPSTPRTDMMETFANINDILKAMSAKKAANVVKPLLDSAVFPVLTQALGGKRKLMKPSNTTWFIADRKHLRDSFLGKLPLLDFSIEEVDDMLDLIKALNLHKRKLSPLVDCRCHPKGQLEYSIPASWYFRTRAPFIKALTASSKSEQKSWSKLLERARVSFAAGVERRYVLETDSKLVQGHPEETMASCFVSSGSIKIFLARDFSLDSQSAVAAVVEMVSQHFDFKDPLIIHLLYTLFSEKDHDMALRAFGRQGFQVDASELGSCQFYPRELGAVPSPFESSGFVGDASYVSTEPTRLGVRFTHKKGFPTRKSPEADRRLPIKRYIDFDDDSEEARKQLLEPDYNLEYLGQRIVSSFFARTLGHTYTPNLHWKSRLRFRGGLDVSDIPEESFPFIIADPDGSKTLTDMLTKSGLIEAKAWEQNWPAYHFELAISEGGKDDQFTWTWEQLERIRLQEEEYDSQTGQENVVVMIRIYNVFKLPSLQFVLDPWEAIWSRRSQILKGSIFKIIMLLDHEEDIATAAAQLKDSSTNTDQVPTITITEEADDTDDRTTQQNPQSLGHVNGYQYNYTPTFQQQPFFAPPSYASYDPSWLTSWAQPTAYWTMDGQLIWNYPIPASHGIPEKLYNAASQETSDDSEYKTPLSREISTEKWDKLPKYKYSRLKDKKEIRVFVLLPGKEDDVLRGVIQTCPFKDPIAYNTVSYVWGGNQQPRYKLLTPEGVLNIQASLFLVLKRIRKTDKPMVLWVDAICINQNDKKEKSQQVKLLPQIFQRSECTYAFLAKDPGHDTAIKMLTRAFIDLIGINDKTSESLSDISECPDDLAKFEVPSQNDPIWQDLAELLDHTWFKRVWIVQEAVASPSVIFVCDKLSIGWNVMSQALTYLDSGRSLPPEVSVAMEPFTTLDNLREWDARQTRWSILLLLEGFRGLQSGLKRDRFYALLGIACDGNLPDFEPDYEIPFEDVVITFARALVSNGEGIQLLHRAGISTQPDRFPSWIPDWTVPKSPSLDDSLSRGIQYHTCGSDKNVRISCLGKDELLVIGYQVDKIARITKSSNTPGSWRQYFAEIHSMVESLQCSSGLKQSYLWEVPVAGSRHGRVAESDYIDLVDSYKAFQKFMKKMKWKKGYKIADIFNSASSEESRASEEGNLAQRSRSYAELLTGTLEGWRFVNTEEGRCGVVPPDAQVGDEVLIVGGGNVPFLFRKSTKRQGSYQLVGECYVDGIMQGEVFDEDKDINQKIVNLVVH